MNIRMVPFLFFTLLLVSQSACSQEHDKAAMISGKINLREDWLPRFFLVQPKYYKQVFSNYEGTVVDSVDIAADGSFSFPRPAWLKEKGLYLLFIQPKDARPAFRNEIAFPPFRENYICLALSPGAEIQLAGDAWQLSRSYRLEKADAENRMLAQLQSFRAPLFEMYDELRGQADSVEEFEWPLHGTEEIQQKMYASIDQFLDTTEAILPALAALRIRATDNEFRDRPEFFLQLRDRLEKLAPGNEWIGQWSLYLDPSKLPVLQGETMPDFALPDTKGDTLHLKDVLAPLVLVDFWASWCAPCRAETRNTIAPLYQQYHDKGFNVLGVSIDADRRSWLNAIQKDGAVWSNVSDLMGDASPVRESLKFVYIPSNYLLDGTGKLLARNLHKEELRNFVERYFEGK